MMKSLFITTGQKMSFGAYLIEFPKFKFALLVKHDFSPKIHNFAPIDEKTTGAL